MLRRPGIRERFRRRRRPEPSPSFSFACNICGGQNSTREADIGRESISCLTCGSILRWRSVVAALSVSLHGRSLALADFPESVQTVGLGMSDWDGYADRLSRICAYSNTFYDEEPRFDVMAPVPDHLAGTYDFIITSDVLEHVAPPYERALQHLRELLKPGGLLVLTVPMKPDGPTDEHFPDLHEYGIVTLGQDPVLVNRTRSGTIEVFEDLVFHGGPGATLEMRLFSLSDLLGTLGRVGFEDFGPFDRPIPEHGIVWNTPCSWPIVARAPR